MTPVRVLDRGQHLAAEEVEADKVSRVVVKGEVVAGGASHLPTGTELDAA